MTTEADSLFPANSDHLEESRIYEVTEYRLLSEEMSAHVEKMKKRISGTLNIEPGDCDLEHTNVY